MQRFENKYDLLDAAYKDVTLKKGTIALLQYLVHKSNKEQCFPAVETIAKALGCCKRTVQYNMRKLERAGYVLRKDRWYNHQQLSNQYVFNFGVIEDAPCTILFAEEEYKKLNQVFFNIPDKQVKKISEIKNIYEMKLSMMEKQILIYLCHRANKKGIAYELYENIQKALGVGTYTFKRILKSLVEKGLINLQEVLMNGKKYLVVQRTEKKGIQENPESKTDNIEIGIQQNKSKWEEDQHQEKKKSVQYIQNRQVKTKDLLIMNVLKKVKKKYRKSISRYFNSLIAKFTYWARNKQEKIRKILRI